MGKHKSKRKPAEKKGPPALDKQFTCPFCNHEKAVTCTLNKKERIGTVKCTKCNTDYSTTIHGLTEEIDVYHDWIDACEKANRPAKRQRTDEV